MAVVVARAPCTCPSSQHRLHSAWCMTQQTAAARRRAPALRGYRRFISLRAELLGLLARPRGQATPHAAECARQRQLGRQGEPHVLDISKAGKMIAAARRVRMKQIRLGRRGNPAVQETALTGNTILFAQPTADDPSLELPPQTDTLVDSLTVIYTHSIEDLSNNG